jgi:hypothetical protein
MTQQPKPRWLAILAFVIAVAALAAFIYLGRKMAAPYPKKPADTNAPKTAV